MKRMILVCWLCLAATSAYAESVEGNWIADKKTGCRVWYPYHIFSNNFLTDIDEITWSGKCKKGMVDGKGTLKGYKKDEFDITIKGNMNDGRCFHDCSLIVNHDRGGHIEYTGELKDNVPHGHGTMIYPETEGCIYKKYTGEWKDGEWSGKGELSSVNDEEYSGEFQDGLKHGNGTLVYSENNKEYDDYAGEFKYDEPNGNGIMIYKNGDKYSGGWTEGTKHGKGTYTPKNGIPYQELWENGQEDDGWRTDEKISCQVRKFPSFLILYDRYELDGSVAWSGECEDGKASGKGTLRLYEKKI